MIRLRPWLYSSPALNLFAGYFCFISISAAGLLSLPVAVHFLDKERIGLWSLISQVAGYLLFLELGVGASAGRLLAGPLAAGKADEIARVWSTILAVLAVQGAMIAVLGWFATPWFISYFNIPAALADDARFVWVGLAWLHASAFPLRAYAGVLLCQERYHWPLVISGCLPWVNLAVFFVALDAGLGLRSYVFANLAINLLQFVWLRWLLERGPQRPRYQHAQANWDDAKPILAYSASIMLWSVAPALVASIPPVVLGRQADLEAIGLYMVTFRVPQMVAMLALRGYHAFFPKLQNLHVLGKPAQFRVFYRLATALSLWMTGLGLALALGFNREAVSWLSRPDFYAGDWTTFWFVVGFMVMAASEHLGTLFIIAGRPGIVSLVLLGEVLVTYGVARSLAPHYGLAGVAAALALSPLLVRLPYYLWHAPRACAFTLRDLYGNAGWIVAAGLAGLVAMQVLRHAASAGAAVAAVVLAVAAVACAVVSLRGTWRDYQALQPELHA